MPEEGEEGTVKFTINIWCTDYTPGIYAKGYIVFVFPFVIRTYVCWLVRSFILLSVVFYSKVLR